LKGRNPVPQWAYKLKNARAARKTGIAMAVCYRIMTGVAREFQTIAKEIRYPETQVL
jgi:hypothetical protein